MDLHARTGVRPRPRAIVRPVHCAISWRHANSRRQWFNEPTAGRQLRFVEMNAIREKRQTTRAEMNLEKANYEGLIAEAKRAMSLNNGIVALADNNEER